MTITNPVKAIRAKCLDCCAGEKTEVKLCPSADCPLYPFRFGKNPYRAARTMSDEQKAAAAARLANFRCNNREIQTDCDRECNLSPDEQGAVSRMIGEENGTTV